MGVMFDQCVTDRDELLNNGVLKLCQGSINAALIRSIVIECEERANTI